MQKIKKIKRIFVEVPGVVARKPFCTSEVACSNIEIAQLFERYARLTKCRNEKAIHVQRLKENRQHY